MEHEPRPLPRQDPPTVFTPYRRRCGFESLGRTEPQPVACLLCGELHRSNEHCRQKVLDAGAGC